MLTVATPLQSCILLQKDTIKIARLSQFRKTPDILKIYQPFYLTLILRYVCNIDKPQFLFLGLHYILRH